MKKLLIIDTHPFGKLTDCYKWCQYLRPDYSITVVCMNDNTTIVMDGVNIIRVSNQVPRSIRGVLFVLTCLWQILFHRGCIFVVYFEKCSFLKRVFPWKKMHVDVRTVSVWGNQDIRDRYDENMREECLRFDSISVISQGVKDRLKLHNAKILPLGADVISSAKRQYENLSLVYVGTMDDRRIEDTIVGLSKFVNLRPNVKIHYDIIGDGHHNEVIKLRTLVSNLGISDIVTLHGRIESQKLTPFFDIANYGVCYIPINQCFNIQPPTKTFEYVMSGLYCIATSTTENTKIINADNGILISDNSDSFCQALEYIYNHRFCFNEKRIRNSLINFKWDKIVDSYMKPILQK